VAPGFDTSFGQRPANAPVTAVPVPIPPAPPEVTALAAAGDPGAPSRLDSALSAPTTLVPLVRPTGAAGSAVASTFTAPDTRSTSAPPDSSAASSPAPVSTAPASTVPASPAAGSIDDTDATPTSPGASGEPTGPDVEQVLANYPWQFHHDTLREIVAVPDELRELRDGLTIKINFATDNATRARLLSLRAVISRILGELSKAMSDAKLALAHAEATGELRRIAIAQARLAHVLQWRGDFAEADRLFALANSPELPDRLRGTMHEHAGKSAYDQGRFIEACNHFEKALELRKEEDPDLIARTELALDAVYRKIAEHGCGPYPRSQEELLQLRKPPMPMFDVRTQLWGFINEHGQTVVSPQYGDVQPYRDEVAWVRPPELDTWGLIDENGETLIDPLVGYLGFGSFSEGLAWVSRDGHGAWIAIDKASRMVISTGYDDVRPFRRGLSVARKGNHWGAVDKAGRVIVPFLYDGFATSLVDGRYIDGFTDEGLAVVHSDGRRGVVDKSGNVVVEPTYPALVVHPVAFLFVDPDTQRWGALDRKGRMLVDPEHGSRIDVIDTLDRMLADTKAMI
jgi:tetratricopeptide (TPR) repeat protein